ncbi:regulatory protein RecX [Thalassolituus sp. LLYu03]|uniref:regulatory protein RecX n=1 Tax=Thalassolituus sp. LLYu03 TaxID=3421656 RepID=UPI003D2C5B9C
MKNSKPDLLSLPELRRAAVDLLSRRDHSRTELFRKLSVKAASAEELNSLLDELAERRWQSDERFAESFVNSRTQRGQGPVRMRQELRGKGVADSDIRQVMDEQETDWRLQALETARRRLGSHYSLSDPKELAKLHRFLAYRGFTSDQIQYAVRCLKSGELTDFPD